MITTDADLILTMFSKGHLGSVKYLNERYIQFSGTIETEQGYNTTNFVIASYITARGRINLHKGIMAVQEEYPESKILYCDTDSIYVGNMPVLNRDGPFYKQYIDDLRLGAFKPEMQDKVSCDTAEGVFVMNKGYALRNPVTGEESIKCKGLPEWLIKND